ncbi:MAG: thiamine pyrophosphate-binding protein [Nitrospirae bacterium YQR-1]
MAEKTGKYKIIEQLLADGITHMFGNPGTSEEGFLDAVTSYPEFTYITTLQETIAVAIADGYARKRQKPAVVQLHSGVGLGNGVGMIYQAMRGHSPLVILAGESGIKYDSMDAQMAADLVAIAKPVVKWAARVVDPNSVLRMLRRAIKMAQTPPMGPVFLCLPMDVLDAPNIEDIVKTPVLYTAVSPDTKILREVAQILSASKNPMIIAGDGISESGAQHELLRVAAEIGAEVWTTNSSTVNMPTSYKLYCGDLGHMFGSRSSAITSKADAVLICGTYLFPEVFPALYNVFKPGAKVIHIDLNSYEIAKNFPVDIGIVADPKLTLNNLLSALKEIRPTQEQWQEIRDRMSAMDEHKAETLRQQKEADLKNRGRTPLYPSEFMEALSKKLPKDAIIFDEALTTSPDIIRYMPADMPSRYFQTRGGSLGVGVPGAIGIKVASPDKTVIGFSGDGGSMYTIQALWTAARYNIGAKFIITNNQSYRLLKDNIIQYWKEIGQSEHTFPESFCLKKPAIRFDELARALSVDAVRVEKSDQIDGAIDKMLNTNGPFLIDLVIESNPAGWKEGCDKGEGR